MRKLVKNVETKINMGVIAFRTKLMAKNAGDGHYVAIAIGLLLSLAIGGIIWAIAGGNSGIVTTWINKITTKVTDFINKITA
jgi:hypothetical protein